LVDKKGPHGPGRRTLGSDTTARKGLRWSHDRLTPALDTKLKTEVIPHSTDYSSDTRMGTEQVYTAASNT